MKYTLYYTFTPYFIIFIAFLMFAIPKIDAYKTCLPKQELTIEQDTLLTVGELYLCNYIEVKMKNIGLIKIKLRQLVAQLGNNREYVVLEQLYEAVGGLVIIYNDKYLTKLYYEIKDILDSRPSSEDIQ